MDITVKCPNCFQQVSRENRYCIFCGYDLFETPAASSAAAEPTAASAEPAGAAFYDGPRYCPKGHDVPDPSLGFCPTCGSPLVNEPAESSSAGAAFAEEPEAPAAYAEPPRVASVRKCSCGYLCDDPDLNFCPACGLPLDAASSATEDGWTCVCGTVNAADMNYCESCGKPRGWRPEPKPVEPKEEIHIPSGMKPPAEGDLEIKSKYGN